MKKIVINNHENNALSIFSWTINRREDERVSVDYKGKSYTLLLGNEPSIQVRMLDKKGEPLEEVIEEYYFGD